MTEATKKKPKFTFLHVTDCHLTKSENVETIDKKIDGGGMPFPLRSEMLRKTLASLAEELGGKGENLDAVLFSGDGTLRGDQDGQIILRDILLTELASVGITRANIVATPGNHDIVARSEPSESARYRLFQNAWLDSESVVVPFLDGVHKSENPIFSEHVLKDAEGAWAIFPINTANWSQLSIPDKEDSAVALLRKHIGASGEPTLSEALERLCTYDVARISDDQLCVLKKMVAQAGKVCLRIAVLHHHLLPVASREEFKPFADITNLGQIRQVLRELGFHIVVHGHKHVTAAYYDHIYPDNSESALAHRILTVSGGTFGPTGLHPDNPLRLIEVEGIPNAPVCRIRNVSSVAAGRELKTADSQDYRLWEDDQDASGTSTIYGKSIDDVYARAIQLVKRSPDRSIICTIDFPGNEETPFPLAYPYGDNLDERKEWFEETVRWWQLPASRIEARIPYIHGSRLKRFGGGIDQVDRVVELLKAQKSTSSEQATSKAIAFVVDPARDFSGKPFASFCFVQFCIRPDNRLDCIGYYRAQEFNYWWPVNVAELRHLQLEVSGKVPVSPGKITTITPYPRLSEGVRHPAKVAVPLIDQWVDNHPVRIAQIALALTNKASASSKEGRRYWTRCLEDLAQAATDYHEDGVQVSIEGLELLKDWLAAAGESQGIIKQIDDLLAANRSLMGSSNKKEDFDRWKKQVNLILGSLRRFPSTP